jgi:hypothetical protein
MRDYYPLLSRIVAGLDSNTGESRRALYGRARTMLWEQLRKQEPPLSDAEITRERLSLEAAIRKFEADAIRRPRKEPPADAIVMPENKIAAGLASALPPENAEPKSGPMTRSTPPDPPSEPPRKQIAELALLAQVVEAREGQIRRPTASPRSNSVSMAGQQRPAPPQTQRAAIPQDLLPAGVLVCNTFVRAARNRRLLQFLQQAKVSAHRPGHPRIDGVATMARAGAPVARGMGSISLELPKSARNPRAPA